MIEVKLKTINELVKEGYEVTVNTDEICIENDRECFELSLDIYEESVEIECHRDSDGDIIENCRDEVIYKQFIKKLVNDELFTTQLKNHTLVLNDDLTIKVGCETIDKKKALEIGIAILKANGYNVN